MNDTETVLNGLRNEENWKALGVEGIPAFAMDAILLIRRLDEKVKGYEGLVKERFMRKHSNDDLAENIFWILIEEGQHNPKFHLGDTITNTPNEVRDIIRKHIKELR